MSCPQDSIILHPKRRNQNEKENHRYRGDYRLSRPVCRRVATGRNGRGTTRIAPNTRRKRPRADWRRGQIRNRNRFAPEKEKAAIPQSEQTQEAVTEPKSAPAETPTVQSAPEPEPVPEVSYGLAPEQAAEPPVAKTTIEPPSGDAVYVPGFGWIQSEGPNHVEYAEDMYENGNKIGTMG